MLPDHRLVPAVHISMGSSLSFGTSEYILIRSRARAFRTARDDRAPRSEWRSIASRHMELANLQDSGGDYPWA